MQTNVLKQVKGIIPSKIKSFKRKEDITGQKVSYRVENTKIGLDRTQNKIDYKKLKNGRT